MRQDTTSLTIESRARGLTEITAEISAWVGATSIETGLLTVFCRHTSASLILQENADPDVARDLEDFFDALAPESTTAYRHSNEGLDDMPAHIKTALTGASLSIPVLNGKLALGTWQGVFLFEHRTRSQCRNVVLHLIGD